MVNPDQRDKEIAWFRYLFCSRVLRKQFENSFALQEHDFVYWHNPTGFVYMMHFFGSLYTVIEGWIYLRLTDPVIDIIILWQAHLIDLLRRCRNAAFHYQEDPLIMKLARFLQTGEAHIVLTRQLQDEFVRYYWNWVDRRIGTREEKAALKESLRQLVGWFPKTISDEEREIAGELAAIYEDLRTNDYSPESRMIGMKAKVACEAALVEFRKASDALEKIRRDNLAALGVTSCTVDGEFEREITG